MKRCLLLLSVCLLSGRVLAGYYGVGVDPESSAAISTAMETVNLQEGYISNHLSLVLKNYQAAEVAAAGIWSQIRLEREAMNDVASLALQEGAYYVYICNLVSGRIMPKIIDVATLCVRYPDRALYWGPFLFKVTEDVKNLCMQFEQLCTNGRLSFKNQISFLRISDSLIPYFDLSKIGDINWRQAFDEFVDFGKDITRDALMHDIDYVISRGKDIISGGALDAGWTDASDVCQIFQGKENDLLSMVTGGDSFFNTDYFSTVEGIIGSRDSLALPRLFQIDEYDISGFLNSLPQQSSSDSTYYTQRWYIGEDPHEEIVVDYVPVMTYQGTLDTHWDSDEYYAYVGATSAFFTEDQRWMFAKSRSEDFTGWSQARVDELNSSDGDYEYSISYRQYGPVKVGILELGVFGTSNITWDVLGIGYAIKVTRHRRNAAIVWEDVFNSSEDILSSFTARANEELLRLQREHPGAFYTLNHDEAELFTVTTEREVTGVSNVKFITYCSGSDNICDGDFSWKENGSQDDCIQDYTMYQYAMEASPGASLSDNMKYADVKIDSLYNVVSNLNTYIIQVSSKLHDLYQKKNNASYAQLEVINSLIHRYDSIRAVKLEEYNTENNKLNEAMRCRDELSDEYNVDDVPHRIPALEDKLTSVYALRFNDDAKWEKLNCETAVYTRTASLNGAVDAVTLRCELTIVRRESHNWLIGRYHRAILNVHWELSGDYMSDDIVETIDLPMDITDYEKARIVNERSRYWKSVYPDCRVEHEFVRYEDPYIEEPQYEAHLLWNGDRLRIARKVVYSLNHIYARLVFMERQLYFGGSLLEKADSKLRWALSSRANHNTFGTRFLNYWLNTARYMSMSDSAYLEDRKRRIREELDSISRVAINRKR